MSVLSLEFLRFGNCSLSRNKGLASINFLSSESITALADLVSPYLDSCSFSLQKEKKRIKKGTFRRIVKLPEPVELNNSTKIPEIIQGQELGDLLKEILIESSEDLEILHQYIHSLGPFFPVNATPRKPKNETLAT